MCAVYKGLPKQVLTVSKNTQEYTIDDMYAELEECKKMLAAIGYTEVTKNNYTIGFLNKRVKKLYGHCEQIMPKHFMIRFNENFVRTANPDDFHECLCHELLHSINGGMKHTGRWAHAAERVNRLYNYPVPISRLGSSKEYREKYLDSQYRHKITCTECGRSWKYLKMTSKIKACINGKATCPCGSHSFEYDFIGGK